MINQIVDFEGVKQSIEFEIKLYRELDIKHIVTWQGHEPDYDFASL
jgi:hypothetical protein